jgi:DNA-binding MarR family transcriptional regulator
MSLTVDRLERKGYVVRLRDAADRRRVHLRLTAAGVRVREATSVLDPSLVEALVTRLSDEERDRAVQGLALLARAAHELGARRGEPAEGKSEKAQGK